MICCMSISSLLIGWYPEKAYKKVATSTIAETVEDERILATMSDEAMRRHIKTVVHYRLDIGKNERSILERIVEAEAGDQDITGRQMVANVIINRVLSDEFPDDIESVVFSHRQFSPISDGSYYRVEISDETVEAVEIALTSEDNTKGALYFMCRSISDATNVNWFDSDLTWLYTHGCHEFFK